MVCSQVFNPMIARVVVTRTTVLPVTSALGRRLLRRARQVMRATGTKTDCTVEPE